MLKKTAVVSGRKTKQRGSPQHSIVAATLVSQIASGKYSVGSLLPTEYELSEEFQRSRQTIREALRRVAGLGMVTRQPGVGTRVVRQTPGVQYSYSINSLSELEDYAGEARLVVEDLRSVTVRGETARALRCSDGAVWHHIRGRRFRKSDGVPVGLSEIYLRAWYPGVEERLRHTTGAIHVMLAREYDVHIEEIRQNGRAVLLSADEAAELAAAPDGPAMEVVRQYYVSGERLILMGRIIYPADRFAYSFRFRRTEEG